MVLEMILSANTSSKSATDITVGDSNYLKYCIFACFLYCNRQVHRDFLVTLYLRKIKRQTFVL